VRVVIGREHSLRRFFWRGGRDGVQLQRPCGLLFLGYFLVTEVTLLGEGVHRVVLREAPACADADPMRARDLLLPGEEGALAAYTRLVEADNATLSALRAGPAVQLPHVAVAATRGMDAGPSAAVGDKRQRAPAAEEGAKRQRVADLGPVLTFAPGRAAQRAATRLLRARQRPALAAVAEAEAPGRAEAMAASALVEGADGEVAAAVAVVGARDGAPPWALDGAAAAARVSSLEAEVAVLGHRLAAAEARALAAEEAEAGYVRLLRGVVAVLRPLGGLFGELGDSLRELGDSLAPHALME